MDSKSLMIGDWILYGDRPVKVLQLSENSKYDWVKPIPLTPEILEKNGCTMVDKGDYGEWHIKENPNIPLWQHTEFIIFGGIEIHSVHELQHALRLCGLNNLADNFQI